ncbi:MAG TPA: hypothetical protein VNN81_18290 [Bradyrhizobium sp.]|nr:hypothetical protein [Bradyrhizobium sp.]
MESANRHLDARGSQLRRDIDGACELVSLYSDHEHQTAIRIAPESADDRPHRDLSVGFIMRFDLYVDLRAEDVAISRVHGEPINTRQRI